MHARAGRALAEAALADTLAAVAATPADRRVLVLDGPARWLPAGFEVVAQRGGGLDERLAHAFEDVGGPALLIGMDTPQVTPAARPRTRRLGAGRRGPRPGARRRLLGARPARAEPRALVGVPMSTAQTGRAQRERLRAAGLRVGVLAALRDVDTIEDARAVAARPRVGGSPRRSRSGALIAARLYADALHGLAARAGATMRAACCALPLARWLGPAGAVDERVLERARGPVLDVGCGPGRHVHALARRGVLALGVDVSPVAVRLARARGAPCSRPRSSTASRGRDLGLRAAARRQHRHRRPARGAAAPCGRPAGARRGRDPRARPAGLRRARARLRLEGGGARASGSPGRGSRPTRSTRRPPPRVSRGTRWCDDGRWFARRRDAAMTDPCASAQPAARALADTALGTLLLPPARGRGDRLRLACRLPARPRPQRRAPAARPPAARRSAGRRGRPGSTRSPRGCT